MIDDKKIEDVANEYSQDNCGYSYNINKFLAFKAGAKWAINEFLKNLWHPANEVPEIGRVIIMENYYPDGRIMFISHMRNLLFITLLILVILKNGFILMIYFQRKEVSNERA